jgi:hypothetical protein
VAGQRAPLCFVNVIHTPALHPLSALSRRVADTAAHSLPDTTFPSVQIRQGRVRNVMSKDIKDLVAVSPFSPLFPLFKILNYDQADSHRGEGSEQSVSW